MSTLFKLALKLILRDWRSGELAILLGALIVAVGAATTVSLLSDRLNRTMSLQAAEFLGGDLSVSSHTPPPPDWTSEAERLGLQHTHTAEFSSVLVENSELLLAGIKSVAAGYPLRGAVKVSAGDISQASAAADIPAPGEAWAEPRVLSTLHLALGDTLTVGEQPLRITRLIAYEPDRRGDLYSLAPRVILNDADLAATRIVQPGSHVHYFALFAGEDAAVRAFKDWLKPRLHPGERLSDLHEDRPELGNALTRAARYLGLTSVAVALIAGVAIAMSARRYTERHFDLAAMLKVLGSREREVLFLFICQFSLIGLAGSFFGCALGYGLQAGVAYALSALLPRHLAEPGLSGLLVGVVAGLPVLFGFALPPILRLKRLPPLRALRRDLEPLPSSAWLVYGCAALALGVLLWRYTEDLKMTVSVLAMGGAALGVFSLAGLGLLGLGKLLVPRVPLAFRLGLQHLTRRPKLGVGQMLAFGVTLAAMLLSLLVRTELLQEWRRQLPANTPNHFALNLFDADLDRFRDFLAQEGLGGNRPYPVVRGRLTLVNGQDVFQLIGKNSRAEGAINRDLSLTWSAEPPPDNRIVAGEWWHGPSTAPAVSIEQELAKNLGVAPGDRLTFNIAGRDLVATVASLRSVRWDTMSPNFFMIFAPGVLDDQPHTWLTSFYLPPAAKPVLAKLAKAFPGVTLLEVDALLQQFQSILGQVTFAIEQVLLLALAAGFAVLFAAVRSTLDERIHEDTLLRAMGASRKLLRRAQWVEFSALGFLAGVLAALIAEAITWTLYSRVFGLAWRFHWEGWLATPLLGALAVGWAGYWNTRKVVKHSPARVLREL
jgi:putative ABC transport system permease protein